MKHEWEQVYKMYRLDPAPPVLWFQEYIRLYFEEKDSKYLTWFLHYYEKKLNAIATDFVWKYGMPGHFADIKQAYVEEMLTLLEKYDISSGVFFLAYLKKQHIKNAIHRYIRTMRTGFTVQSDDEYKKLRAIMGILQELGGKMDPATLERIAARVKDTPENVKDILISGARNTRFVDFYRKFAEEDGEDEEREEAASDGTSQTEILFFRIERAQAVMVAFEKLDYRERLIVSEHLGFCLDCYGIHYVDPEDLDEYGDPKEKPIPKAYFADLALDFCLTPGSVERIYQNALKKMRAELKDI